MSLDIASASLLSIVIVVSFITNPGGFIHGKSVATILGTWLLTFWLISLVFTGLGLPSPRRGKCLSSGATFIEKTYLRVESVAKVVFACLLVSGIVVCYFLIPGAKDSQLPIWFRSGPNTVRFDYCIRPKTFKSIY